MKMKKLLSIGALVLAINTCTSISAFAAESVGNRNKAAKEIAMNAYTGREMVNNSNITVNTPVKNYVKQPLVDKIIDCINKGISDENTKQKVVQAIESGYENGKGFKDIFNSLVEINNDKNTDITTDETFKVAKKAMEDMLYEFEKAYDQGDLENTIDTYFNVKALTSNGKLYYGKNSNNRLVVTLEKDGQVILQVSSENVYSLQKEIENNIHSWADLKEYYNKIK